jgi:hypothetical protein
LNAGSIACADGLTGCSSSGTSSRSGRSDGGGSSRGSATGRIAGRINGEGRGIVFKVSLSDFELVVDARGECVGRSPCEGVPFAVTL